jgi:hypothetical protein
MFPVKKSLHKVSFKLSDLLSLVFFLNLFLFLCTGGEQLLKMIVDVATIFNDIPQAATQKMKTQRVLLGQKEWKTWILCGRESENLFTSIFFQSRLIHWSFSVITARSHFLEGELSGV